MKRPSLSSDELHRLLGRIGGGETPEPRPDLGRATLSRINPAMRAIRARRRFVITRVALAGIVSFPLVVGLNAAAAWILYSILDRIVPNVVAAGVTAMTALTMLLALSLTYGSLPLLLSVGLRRAEVAS